MSAKRGALLALALGLVAAAVWLGFGRAKPRTTAAPSATRADDAVANETRPRRARAERPRPPARETREASVATTSTAEPSTPSPASAPSASPRVRALETTVLQAAVRHDWVVVDEQDTPCPPQKVRVVFDAPGDLGGYQKGAYFEPLGPGPGDSDVEVNGLLLCEGSTFLYRGFEAYWRADRGVWEVFPFPVIE
ncbi:MAG: hypothetical protein IPM35_23890 [Myxococcales bacterium]|nr:hypothetical protein [Myxococcales bacterium]